MDGLALLRAHGDDGVAGRAPGDVVRAEPRRAERTERDRGRDQRTAGRVEPDLADWLADVRAGVAGDDVVALLVDVEREGPGLHALVEPGHGPRRIVGGGEVGLDDHEAVAGVEVVAVVLAVGLADEHERVVCAREGAVAGGLRERVRRITTGTVVEHPRLRGLARAQQHRERVEFVDLVRHCPRTADRGDVGLGRQRERRVAHSADADVLQALPPRRELARPPHSVVPALALDEHEHAAGLAVDLQVDGAAVRGPQQRDEVHRLHLVALLVAHAQVAARRAHLLVVAELDGSLVREHGDRRHAALGALGLPVGLVAGLGQGDHVVGVHGLAHEHFPEGREYGCMRAVVQACKGLDVPEELARANQRQLDQRTVVEQHRHALGVDGGDLHAQQAVVVDVVGDDDAVDDLRRLVGLAVVATVSAPVSASGVVVLASGSSPVTVWTLPLVVGVSAPSLREVDPDVPHASTSSQLTKSAGGGHPAIAASTAINARGGRARRVMGGSSRSETSVKEKAPGAWYERRSPRGAGHPSPAERRQDGSNDDRGATQQRQRDGLRLHDVEVAYKGVPLGSDAWRRIEAICIVERVGLAAGLDRAVPHEARHRGEGDPDTQSHPAGNDETSSRVGHTWTRARGGCLTGLDGHQAVVTKGRGVGVDKQQLARRSGWRRGGLR
jgi:hypothetical protein